ncbi:MAG: carboxypeptidase-like regulatory domain-containing protein [Bacteriodetes bacterium]|nr:carboxypeptidase-like regulatory domain-containing protein [Bacteroidota bacterium]
MDSHNTLLFTTLLVMHIIGGSASLLAGVLASFSEKGRLFHRTVGKVYVIAMAVVFVTAIAMAVLHPNLFLAAVGVFSFYNAWSGFMAMQQSGIHRLLRYANSTFTVATVLASVALLLIGFTNGNTVAGFFGMVSVFSAGRDMLSLFGVLPLQQKLVTHISRMGGAMIATITAILVVNFQMPSPIPGWLAWILPSVVGSVIIARAIRKYIKKPVIALLMLVLCSGVMVAQTDSVKTPTQTIKGVVRNSSTKQPLTGVTVQVAATKLGAISKSDGSFKINRVPVGRYTLQARAVGYEPLSLAIVLTSGKQFEVSLELTESFVQSQQVTVTASQGGFTPINESSITSANVFSVDDAYRYAGSRGDPARMAQNYGGIVSANDQRNDIIIRGGSPAELLWRLDGLDIPNPNHFATQGATGGPISTLNINLLDNSDFLTGAFPAEYGDRMSGVFDLRTRKGNSDRYEFTGQFGFNGIELVAEGPMPMSKSSFVASYRYSFLDLMEKMGVDFGWSGTPKYQDGAVKADWQLSDNDHVSLTGLYGTSDIYIQYSKLDTVFTGDRDIKNGTDVLSVGANWQHLFGERSYAHVTVGTVQSTFRTDVDSITTDSASKVLAITQRYSNYSTESYHTAKVRYVYVPTSQHTFTVGSELRYRFYNIDIKAYTQPFYRLPDNTGVFALGDNNHTVHSLSYVNWNWRVTEDFTLNSGLHAQYLQISNKLSLEPRLSLAYTIAPEHTITLGTGIFRQSQPLTMYTSRTENESLDFTQCTHGILGYSWSIAEDMQFKTEAYYKYYTNAPVLRDKSNGVNYLNAGANFGSIDVQDVLVNNGKGKSYGAEFTFRKNFSNGWYTTATTSLVRQEYTGSDGIWRFGAFDNRYIVNLLAGYEWKISPTFTMEFSGKFTHAGGAPYTPVSLELSRTSGFTRFDDSQAFALRNPDYERVDFRVDFRNNFEGLAIISYITIENILNKKNIAQREYSPRSNAVVDANQLGFFPVGGVRVEF